MERTLAQLFFARATQSPGTIMQMHRKESSAFVSVTYAEVASRVELFAGALASLGVKRGDNVGFISDNRQEWLVADLAILSLGAVDVPRGCDTHATELAYILGFSDCAFAVLENGAQLDKITTSKQALPKLKTVILFDAPSDVSRQAAEAAGLEVFTYANLMAMRRAPAEFDFRAEVEKGEGSDTATIIFTSGTTGEPKGVVLAHDSFIAQLEVLPEMLGVRKDDLWLSVLPVWHVFERLLQYAAVVTTSGIVYSKPIGSVMLADFQSARPHWFGSVPRIWESVMEGVYRSVRKAGGVKLVLFNFFLSVGMAFRHEWNKFRGFLPEFHRRNRVLDVLGSAPLLLLLSPVWALGNALVFGAIKKKLGGRFIAGISGGGALPAHIDRFFAAVGIKVLEGYGLTETAPVIAVRRADRPVPFTVGKILDTCDVKITDDEGKTLHYGQVGHILVRGRQVMKGYYKKPELTEKVIREGGYLDTGDLGMMTRRGELKITGRAKDTIVLRGGENVEPAPMETRLAESQYIKRAVVVGQDQRCLSALIVPDRDAVIAWAEENHVPILDWEDLVKQPEVFELVNSEVNALISPKNGFRPFERIFHFTLLPSDFETGRELSHKQEVMRHAIARIYEREIKAMFAD